MCRCLSGRDAKNYVRVRLMTAHPYCLKPYHPTCLLFSIELTAPVCRCLSGRDAKNYVRVRLMAPHPCGLIPALTSIDTPGLHLLFYSLAGGTPKNYVRVRLMTAHPYCLKPYHPCLFAVLY